MPRPKLFRTIQSPPAIDGFNPNGAEQKGEVVLSFEEFEAIRLIDFEGLDQSQAADQMGISRQTFGRVLRSARSIIAKALVLGFELKMTGGCYQVRGHGHEPVRLRLPCAAGSALVAGTGGRLEALCGNRDRGIRTAAVDV